MSKIIDFKGAWSDMLKAVILFIIVIMAASAIIFGCGRMTVYPLVIKPAYHYASDIWHDYRQGHNQTK